MSALKLAKFKCDFEGYNNLEVYDNDGWVSVLCEKSDEYIDEYIEVYLSAEDEEKLRVLLNERKESKDD